MNFHETMRILEEAGAIITGSHIVYTSGLHGSAYVNKDAIYPYPKLISRLCMAISWHFMVDEIDVVIAPAIGGVILSQWVAHHLEEVTDRNVLALYAEKVDYGNGFDLRRGYDKHVNGRRILVVEDILTTGGSARKVVEVARGLGGEVVGVGALCNRGRVTAEKVGDVPKLESLVNLTLDSWTAENCPLCKSGKPINTKVGKGRKFLAELGE